MKKYIPVPCEVYGNYELAILRRSKMRFSWRAKNGVVRVISAVPLNIRSRNQGEYLVLRRLSGSLLVLRLDRIIRTTLLNRSRTDESSLA